MASPSLLEQQLKTSEEQSAGESIEDTGVFHSQGHTADTVPDDCLLADLSPPSPYPPTDQVAQVNCIDATKGHDVDECNVFSLLKKFSHVFNDSILPEMSCEPFLIPLQENAQPSAQLKARRVPLPYMTQLKK